MIVANIDVPCLKIYNKNIIIVVQTRGAGTGGAIAIKSKIIASPNFTLFDYSSIVAPPIFHPFWCLCKLIKVFIPKVAFYN